MGKAQGHNKLQDEFLQAKALSISMAYPQQNKATAQITDIAI